MQLKQLKKATEKVKKIFDASNEKARTLALKELVDEKLLD